ncbi:hypothetical protein CFC21_014731 [Triticum aestivum]|uniref:NB-ARC domain-containing protein n=2 Tax=Triticum aestivum TaxID=4565 RepID=A0A9R1DUV6_WHEAT|nr:hypothetical protein CFC21_014731 [Triticum aestivum]
MEGELISTIKTVVSTTTEIISGFNDWVGFFQWLRPDNNQESKQQHEELWKLQTTLPLMQVMIDRAEWSIHKEGVPILLEELKDVTYDTEDLIEEFKYFKMKSEMDGPQSLMKRSLDFIKSDISSSFDKVKLLQQRAEHLMSKLNATDLQQETPRFDRSVRPETSSFPDSKVFGRQKETVALKVLLGVPVSIPSGSKRKKGHPVAAEATAQKDCMDYPVNNAVSVLPIVGIGGVGKTTLAQQLCQDQHVKAYFDQILWTCVSDDFDTKQLTKELVHSCGEEIASDNLDYLQNKLAKVVRLKRFLMVLDDVWDDSVKDNGQEWQKFCAPLTTGVQGSMILVTTRSSKVAKLVCTLNPFQLQGLEEDTFWEFFKTCALGGKSSTMDVKLATIGRMIVPKLKGSPLAAKTLGRLLGMKIDTVHWTNILNSELWELKQEVGDILPALRLSYLYLPRHLRRCLSLCAMFPKDHKFEQTVLVDLWSAQCFAETQDKICMHTAGDWCFEELESRCFFQEVVPSSASQISPKIKKYVMHDLIHDMIQLVSGNECFVIRNEIDLSNVPEKVRHVSLFTSKGFDYQKLVALTRCRKLRSILSREQLGKKIFFPLVNSWSKELKYLRFLSCCFTKLTMLPEAIANFKLLCCFKVHCPRRWTMDTFPESYCSLYNLQKFEAKNCTFKSLPKEFRKLVNLQSFEVRTFVHGRNYTNFWGISMEVLKNMHLQGELYLNLSRVKLAGCAELELRKRKHVEMLTLNFYHTQNTQDQELEMLELLCPHSGIKFLEICGFRGDSTPTWLQPSYLQNLVQLRLVRVHFLSMAWVDNNAFLFINDLYISRCPRLSSLENILKSASLPTVRSIFIEECLGLSSMRGERFGELSCLKELKLSKCPNILWNGLVLPSSLLKLHLEDCGDISNYIPNCLVNLENLIRMSLVKLITIRSIPAEIWWTRSN